MRFFSTILVCAAYVATAIAQTPQIAFTSVPAVVVAGSSYNITWGGGDGISVSRLRDASTPYRHLDPDCVLFVARYNHSAQRQPGQP
jgi:hypothetical protein